MHLLAFADAKALRQAGGNTLRLRLVAVDSFINPFDAWVRPLAGFSLSLAVAVCLSLCLCCLHTSGFSLSLWLCLSRLSVCCCLLSP